MAKKNMADRIAKQLESMEFAATTSSNLQQSISEETRVEDLSEDDAKRVVELTDLQLIDDPLNSKYYGDEEDNTDLIEAMKRYGFQGLILAYPIGDGKYMIESGHRRRTAARKAGLKKYRTYITNPPKAEWEHVMRLFTHNLHSRKEKISRNALIAQGLYEAHEQEIKERKESGEFRRGEIDNINELVSMDMGVSKPTVERYRAYGKLIPDLQKIGDQGIGSWSELSTASVLDNDRQMRLYEQIIDKSARAGYDSVTRPWLHDAIKILKADAAADAIGIASGNESVKVRTPQVRTYGAKAVLKGSDALISMLSSPTVFKEREKAEVKASLKKLRQELDKMLDQLDEKE